MPENETKLQWWVKNVIVPIAVVCLGSGSIIAVFLSHRDRPVDAPKEVTKEATQEVPKKVPTTHTSPAKKHDKSKGNDNSLDDMPDPSPDQKSVLGPMIEVPAK